jgi:hypothetical protein
MSFNAAVSKAELLKRRRHAARKFCWSAPLILITSAGILTKNVEPFSQAQPSFFSSEITCLGGGYGISENGISYSASQRTAIETTTIWKL